MLILKENAANSVPTPPVGKDTFFIDDSGTPSVKNAAGNVTTFPVVNASNSQVVFMNGSSLSGEAALTYDFNNNILNISGNLAATNVKTDNLLYANGAPWDLQQPGGSNTQIQFNDADQFGGSAAFIFNKSSNAVTMTGNLTAANISGGNLVSANFINGTFTTASNAQPNITSVGTLTSLAVTGNITGGNIYANSGVVGASILQGTLSTAAQPNITSVGSLSSLTVVGNANVGNIGGTNGIFTTVSGTLSTAAQPNVTSLGTLTGLGVNGNLTASNITANTGVFTGNGSGLTALTGANVTGTVANATYAVSAGTAGTVTTNAQPNITSVGNLTALTVTGNANIGNIETTNLTVLGNANIGGGSGGNISGANNITANTFTGTLTTNAQPNITSVGTLTSLTVSGNASAGNLSTGGTLSVTGNANVGNIGATNGVFSNVSGNGAALTSLTGANVTGQVANALVAGTVYTAAQPNITSVGTLSSLAVTGNASAGNVNAGNLLTANFVAGTLTTAAQPNITSVGSLSSLTVTGNLTSGNASLGNLITANVANLVDLNVSGNANIGGGTGGNISGANVITANTFVGNLQGIVANGNSNVSIPAANGNVNISAVGTANVLVVTGTGVNVAGTLNATGNANVGNLGATGVVATTLGGNLTTAAQPNITSVGTLTALAVNATVTAVGFTANTGVFTGNGSGLSALAGANVTGQVGNALVAGTVYTNAQPNITSVGTLSSLAVTADGTFGNVYANAGTIGALTLKGEGGNISNITAGNITGQVANALVAGTVYTNAQPNITSVGTLSSLSVTGNVSAGNVSGTLLAGTLTTAAQPNITSVGTLSSLSVTGNVAAGNLTTTGVLSVTGTGTSSIAGNLDMTGNTISNLATPVASTDAATKQYVDDIAQGLHVHAPCVAATPDTLANISSGTVTYDNGTSGVGATLTTTGTYTTIDTVNIASVGTRILVKNEANAAHNGIYTYTSSTVLTRATDFDTPTEMAGGDFTFVQQGATYNDTGWVMPDPVTTVGTTNVVFLQFSGAGTYQAGTGLTLTGSVFSVNASQTQVTALGTVTSGTWNSIVGSSATFAAGLSGANLASITGANVTGTVPAATVAGTVTTAAQPNITSVGTLTSLGVNGTVTAVAFTANTGVFTGNGSGLSAIAGANVTGQVGNALVAGTVYTAAQPNITSVGTLSSLTVSGNASAGNLNTAGKVVASTLESNVATGTAPFAVASTTRVANLNVATAGVSDTITVTTQSSGNAFLVLGNAVTGTIAESANAAFVANTSNGALYATTFIGAVSGNGAALTDINASNISSGTLAQARLANSSLTVNGTAISLGGSGTITANTTQTLTLGSFLTGTSFNGGTAVTAAVDATSANTASKVVARDASGNFSAGTITATLSGAATTAGTVTTAAQPNITSVGTLTGLTLANASTISVGSNTNVGTFTGNFSLSAGSRLNATYADLAEKYVSDADYEPGTVLVFGGEHEVTLANEENSHRVAGVVSTNPAYTMNNECQGDHTVMLALQGRVPVKVHGPVAKGDLMVTGLDGHAVANNMARAGTILGKALANFDGESGIVEIVVGRV